MSRRSVRRRDRARLRPLAAAVAATACLVLLPATLTACTGGPAPAPSGTVATGSPGGDGAPPETPAPVPTVTPAPTLDPVAPETLSTAPRSVTSEVAGRLTSVTARSAATSDQVRFEFADGLVPGYDVRYVDVMERAEDEAVLLAGSAALSVTFTSSAPGPAGTTAPDVVTNETFGLPAVRQIVLVTNLGGTLTFGVGASTQVPFTVTVDGATLVVDLQHP